MTTPTESEDVLAKVEADLDAASVALDAARDARDVADAAITAVTVAEDTIHEAERGYRAALSAYGEARAQARKAK